MTRMRFPALKIRNEQGKIQYFTLDGDKTIETPLYEKHINSLAELNKDEQEYVLSEFLLMKEKLSSIVSMANYTKD